MRSFCLFVLTAALAGSVVGCGGETKLQPLTEDQKKAIQEEDKKVFDEEGGKAQPKGKPGKR